MYSTLKIVLTLINFIAIQKLKIETQLNVYRCVFQPLHLSFQVIVKPLISLFVVASIRKLFEFGVQNHSLK